MSDERRPDGDSDDKPPGGPLEPPRRRVRHIQPLGMRVLVRLLPEESRSPGGLYLPQGVAEKHSEALYGEVVEVARSSGDDASLGENVSGIPAGARVLFPKEAGVRVPWDGELRVLKTEEVLATVEDVDYDETH